jgi:hypothetical protein
MKQAGRQFYEANQDLSALRHQSKNNRFDKLAETTNDSEARNIG